MSLAEALAALTDGGVVGYPTETFYGLAADPCDPRAVARLLELKGRSREAGVPLIIDRAATLREIAESLDPAVERLVTRFWPGPLTLIVQPRADLAEQIQPGVPAGDGSLAVRVSSHPIARQLAAALSGLVTSTSANPHGAPPPRTAVEVRGYYPGVSVVDDPGSKPAAAADKPSTILDVRSRPFRIVREGAIDRAALEAYL